jgi:DNA-binding beta-propeller fold protein YncE
MLRRILALVRPTNHSWGRAATRSCGRAATRSCGRAATRSCGRSATRSWGVAAMLVVVAGCGSTTAVSELPRAAEPDSSPPLEVRPAGRVVPVGNRPEGVVADPLTGLVAVGLREPGRVNGAGGAEPGALALVDGATGAPARRVPLPAAPRHHALAPGEVLVPAEDADALVRVALPGGRVTTARTGREPHDAAAAGGRVFVGDEFAHTVTVLEGDRTVARLPVALQPGGLTPLDRGRQVAVVSVRERVVETFDVETGERTGRAPAGVGPTHAVSDDGDYLFVADTAGGAILVYHVRPRLELIRRYPLPDSPYGMAIDNRRHRMYVTQTGRNLLWELNVGGRLRRLATYPTPRQPNSVAVDERTGRVFVTGKVDGVLQLLDPARERTR